MKKVNTTNVKPSTWVEHDSKIYLVSEVLELISIRDGSITTSREVNLHWWEAIAGNDRIPTWVLTKAYEDGATIESKSYESNGEWDKDDQPDFLDTAILYRVKPLPSHKVSINGVTYDVNNKDFDKITDILEEL